MALHVEDGRLQFFYNGYGELSELSPVMLAMGEIEATREYEALGDRQDRGRLLLLDGVAQTPWQAFSPTLMAGFHGGLDVGLDRRAPEVGAVGRGLTRPREDCCGRPRTAVRFTRADGAP